jgi:hypothetical protein
MVKQYFVLANDCYDFTIFTGFLFELFIHASKFANEVPSSGSQNEIPLRNSKHRLPNKTLTRCLAGVFNEDMRNHPRNLVGLFNNIILALDDE